MINQNHVYIIAATIWLLLSYSILFILSDENLIISLAGKEDGLVETTGAILFLLTSLMFFITFSRNKNFFIFLLGCFFLLCFLEEISWGQRIFNIDTPQSLENVNVQKEINIHNLNIFEGLTEDGKRKAGLALMLSAERLFSLFWFMYCCLLPFINMFHKKTKDILSKFNFPNVPIFIGVFFMFNYLLSKVIEFNINPILQRSLEEIKECNFAFLFFMVSVFFLYRYKNIVFYSKKI
jgi:hypothetical protein